MNKSLSIVCSLAIIFSLSGCGTPPGEQPVVVDQQSEVEKIADQYPEWTQEDLQAYLNRDTALEMSYAGPFYFGSFDGIDSNSKNFSELRRQKVDELIAIIDSGVDVMVRLDKKLREERGVFDWYVKEIQKIDESTKSYTDQVLGATKGNILSESLSNLIVLRNKADKMELGPDWGFLQYQAYGEWIALTDLYSGESTSLMSRATAMYYLLESDSNTAYQDLNTQFIAKMDPVSDEVSEILDELYYTTAVAGYGEKLIFTADYYYAKESLKTADEEIAKAKKAISDYDGSKEYISEGMLEFLNKRLQKLENARNNLTAFLESIPSEDLLSDNELALSNDGAGLFVPVAYAETYDPGMSVGSPGWFQKKISDGVKTVKFVKDMGFAAVRVTGQKIKDVYDKSGAHEVVKDGGQIIGAGLDGVSSALEVAIYGLQGKYYGDFTWEDFNRKIEAKKQEFHDRFVAGKLGKQEYDEIIHQVDQFQKNTQTFVNNMSEFSGFVTTVGTGSTKAGKFVENVTKSVGNEAKEVLVTATDFTKNCTIILHPETSKQETREAFINVGKTILDTRGDDGKLVEVEIPDLVDLTKEKATEEAVSQVQGVLGIEDKEEEKSYGDQLKDLLEEQVTDEETPDPTKKDEKKPDVNKTGGAKTVDGTTPPETNPETDTVKTTEGASSTDDTTDAEPGSTEVGATAAGGATAEDGATDAEGATAEEGATTAEGSTAADRIMTELTNNPDMTDEEFADLIIKEAMNGLPPASGKKDDKKGEENKDIDNDGVENEYDNCERVSNPDQTDTDTDGLGDACDPDCSGDKDGDSVCDEIDNCPNDPNEDQIDVDNDGMGNVCDMDAPLLSEIAGTWPGTITVTEVYISDDLRKQAEAEGCDLSDIEESKDIPKPVSITINPTSETGGNIIMSGADEDEGDQLIPFTYVNGVLQASKSEEDAAMNIEMNFGRDTSSGKVDLDYMGGNAKVQAKLDLKK